jgi:hypothetical protein
MAVRRKHSQYLLGLWKARIWEVDLDAIPFRASGDYSAPEAMVGRGPAHYSWIFFLGMLPEILFKNQI